MNIIELNKIHAVSVVENKPKIFGIVTKERTYYLECDSEAEMHAWISKIEQQIDNVAGNNAAKKSLNRPLLLPTPTVLSNSLERLSTVDRLSPKIERASPVIEPMPIQIPGKHGSLKKQFRAQSAVTNTLPAQKSILTRSYSSYLPNNDQDQPHELKFENNQQLTFQTKAQIDKVWKQGFVYKLNSGIGMKTWKRYWFVLRGNKLISYRNQLVFLLIGIRSQTHITPSKRDGYFRS